MKLFLSLILSISFIHSKDSEVKRIAILIGINEYESNQILSLNNARNDATLLAKVLTENSAFDETIILTDNLNKSSELFPTKNNIETKLDQILNRLNQNDHFLFFFSGQAVTDNENQNFLLAQDSSLDKYNYTGVNLDEIVKKIKSKNFKHSMMILDSNREILNTNRKEILTTGFKSEKYEANESFSFFSSSKDGFFSYEDNKSKFGVFTKFICLGLEGKADYNSDKIITIEEIDKFVKNSVETWSAENDRSQKPFLKYLSKNSTLPISVLDENTKSSVDSKNFETSNSKFPALARSFFIPGWGQYYSGGKEKGISYVSIFLLLGLHSAYRYNLFLESKKNYESTFLIPARAGQGDTFVQNYLIFEPKRKDVEENEKKFNQSLTLVGAFWAWNLLDLFLFKGNDYFWAIQFKMNLFEIDKYSISADKKYDLYFQFRF